jgi:hypothetical protein
MPGLLGALGAIRSGHVGRRTAAFDFDGDYEESYVRNPVEYPEHRSSPWDMRRFPISASMATAPKPCVSTRPFIRWMVNGELLIQP